MMTPKTEAWSRLGCRSRFFNTTLEEGPAARGNGWLGLGQDDPRTSPHARNQESHHRLWDTSDDSGARQPEMDWHRWKPVKIWWKCEFMMVCKTSKPHWPPLADATGPTRYFEKRYLKGGIKRGFRLSYTIGTTGPAKTGQREASSSDGVRTLLMKSWVWTIAVSGCLSHQKGGDRTSCTSWRKNTPHWRKCPWQTEQITTLKKTPLKS